MNIRAIIESETKKIDEILKKSNLSEEDQETAMDAMKAISFHW